MRVMSRRKVASSAVILALGIWRGTGLASPEAPGLEPSMLDVAGVKLGMSVDDALTALKTFNAKFIIEKHYLDRDMTNFGIVGVPLDAIYKTSDSGTDITLATAYLTDLTATTLDKTAPPDGPQDDIDTVSVAFSPTQGHEHIIAVLRTKTFRKWPSAPTATIKEGLFSKYPKDDISVEDLHRGNSVPAYGADWFFDSRKRLISKSLAIRKSLHSNNGDMPLNVMKGDGIGLSVFFEGDSRSSDLVSSMHIALYDSGALYDSVAQGHATYAAIQAKLNADLLAKAQKSAAPTKF